jgi:hypothetical protein
VKSTATHINSNIMNRTIHSLAAALLLAGALFGSTAHAATPGNDSTQSSSTVDSATSSSNTESHLFIASTARSLPAGEGYVSVGGLWWPVLDVAVGATDWLTLNVTATWYPLRSYGDLLPAIFSAKARVLEHDGLDLAIGGSYVTQMSSMFSDIGSGAGALFCIATYGTDEVSATVSLYQTITANGGWTTVAAGGTLRLTEGMALMAEGWIPVGSEESLFTDDGASLLTGGARFMIGSFSADLGAFCHVGTEGLEVIGPLARFSLAFGD